MFLYGIKKKQISIIMCSLLLIIVIIFSVFYSLREKSTPVLRIVFDQEFYQGGDLICYEMEIENKGKYPVYYQLDSFFVEIFSDEGFHAKVNTEGTKECYELETSSIISRNMTGYNSYFYTLAAGVKDFLVPIKVKEVYEPEVAQLGSNWKTGLSLPAGTYQFYAKFSYYLDEKCETKPLFAECRKEVIVEKSATEPMEKTVVIPDRVVLYARTEKTDYKVGERLQTWATYDWLEEGWFPYDYLYYAMPGIFWISLVYLDTGEEMDLSLQDVPCGFMGPEVYRGPYYLEPKVFSVQKAGNYILRYHFGYYMEAGGELHYGTIDFPITVEENENKKEFYGLFGPIDMIRKIK